METNNRNRMTGIWMVLTGAALWGASGVAVQYLFNYKHLTPEWLLTARMFFTAVLFLGWAAFKGDNIFTIWQAKGNFARLLIFSFFGMLGMQLPFFITIDLSNAPTATVLQYLMPIIVLLWSSWKYKKKPNTIEIIAVFLAMLGTYLLVTKGNWSSLAISKEAFLWGILSAFGMAFYTVYPKKLLGENPSLVVLGWSSIITGIFLQLLTWPWPAEGIFDGETWGCFAILIIFGTLFSYFLYLESTRYISPSEVSTLASVEPLTSFILAVTLLHVKFGVIDTIGAFCIILTVFILARQK